MSTSASRTLIALRLAPIPRTGLGLILCLGVTAAPAQPIATWRQIPRFAPPAAFYHAMAYDQARQVTVLFGGVTIDGICPRDTWEWDGTHWTQYQVDGPPACTWHAMAYDCLRGVTVLFGTGPDHNDTWEWDGVAWTLRAPAHRPQPTFMVYSERAHAGYGQFIDTFGLFYDTVRGMTVLVDATGAQMGDTRSVDTWGWDGTDWTPLATTGPSRRPEFGITFDSGRGVGVLVGGVFPIYDRHIGWIHYPLNDTWEWDGSMWRCIQTDSFDWYWNYGGGARLVYDSRRARTILFDSRDPNYPFGGVWEWDGATWAFTIPVHAPNRRSYPALVDDTARGEIVLFGGSDDHDTWAWDGTDWILRETWGPRPSASPGMAYDASRATTVLYSGDTWEWNGSEWSFRLPDRRLFDQESNSNLIYDDARALTVYLRDGFVEGWPRFREWNGTAWSTVSAPGGAYPIAYDAARAVIVGVREFGSESQQVETWEWDGAAWTWRTPLTSSPRARYGAALAFDRARQVTVMFGGMIPEDNGDTYPNETWEWDGTDWRLASTSGPPGRAYYALAYDSHRMVTVLFAGRVSRATPCGTKTVYFNDVWEWDGTTWTRLCSDVPAPKNAGPDMAYDPVREVMLVFGGDENHANLWEMSVLPDGNCPPPETQPSDDDPNDCGGQDPNTAVPDPNNGGGTDPGTPDAGGNGDSTTDTTPATDGATPSDTLEPVRPACGGSPCGAAVGPLSLVVIGVAVMKLRLRHTGVMRSPRR